MQLIELVPVFLQIFCCCLTRAAASPEVKRHWHNSRVCTSSASGDTCDSPSPFISNLNGYPPELPRASSTILGRIPERVSVIPSASDVFVSIKATASYHEARLSLLLLTWMQTLHSNQVGFTSKAILNNSLVCRLGMRIVHVYAACSSPQASPS